MMKTENQLSNPAAAGMKKELYDRWVDEVCAFLKDVGPKLNRCCSAMQSRPVLDKSPEVVFVGIFPDENFGYTDVDRERFYKGNRDFYNNRQTDRWKSWSRLYGVMEYYKYFRPVTDGNFVFMNAIYFGARSVDQLKAIPGSQEAMTRCIRFTGRAISEIFQPKLVVCFSVQHIFEKLHKEFHFRNVETLQLRNGEHVLKKTVKRGTWGDCTVLGVPNPASWGMSWPDFGAIALRIKQELGAR